MSQLRAAARHRADAATRNAIAGTGEKFPQKAADRAATDASEGEGRAR